MFALSPSLFPTSMGYFALENYALGYEDQNYFYTDDANSSVQSTFLDFPEVPPSSDQNVRVDRIDRSATPSMETAISGDDLAIKKLNHNASEQDRRKKINHLYSSLRSLLPTSDYKKKLSIPSIVSQVLKYIPQLQREVEGLAQKREELRSKVNILRKQRNNNFQVKQELDYNNQVINGKSRATSVLPSFSANQLNDKEVALQISPQDNLEKIPLSKILHNLEEGGFSVLNISSFESFGGRTFSNLHLKVAGSYSVEYCGSSQAYASMQHYGVVL